MDSCSDSSGLCAVGAFFSTVVVCIGKKFSVNSPLMLHRLFPLRPISSISHKSPGNTVTIGETCVIFSSGGPSGRETALQIAEVCGQAPIEVLGSTETGGIAFRQQTGNLDWPWQPLPGVRARVHQELLAVCSPFLPEPTTWLPTGDRAELVDEQRFHLRGRADRMVKLSEKRLSLTAMESKLSQHDAVEVARVILLSPQSPMERAHLAAVVVLSQPGRHLLERLGQSP